VTMEQVVDLGRKTMEITLLLAAPILVIAMVVSLVINVLQVLTSVQESMISTVPRLVVAAAAAFVLMPWMLRRIAMFTVQLFSDFRPYLH
jgi:flagellar biosynthetic protein FliQ